MTPSKVLLMGALLFFGWAALIEFRVFPGPATALEVMGGMCFIGSFLVAP